MNHANLGDSPPPNQRRQIDVISSEFERALRSGQSPRIEDHLERVDRDDREQLLIDCLVLELEYRIQAGEAPAKQDYAQRFPQETVAIDAAFALTATAPPQTNSLVGGRIGPYKLLQELGQGGMGTVYLAEQSKPLHRRVAVKVINAGMDSKRVIARFEQERQALALMDHPHIAKILDAGATEAGRPYFVMDRADGMSITQSSDRERLTVWDRLELFVKVCDAIQHAHQKGIMHRDIKPSNVLVTGAGGQAFPKVIDFGLAKALYHKLTDQSVFTEIGAVIGQAAIDSIQKANGTRAPC